MLSFRRAVIHSLTWPYATTRRVTHLTRDRHCAEWRDGCSLPLASQSNWKTQAADPIDTDTQPNGARLPRRAHTTLTQALDVAAKAFSEFVMWIGLLLSAAMVGTFIVLFLAVAYALIMSATGH